MSESSRAADLLEAALALPPAERAAFLDRVCAGDVALRANLASLLRAAVPADGFLATWLPRPAALGEEVGAVIDRYRLLEKLGEGGCGVVYLAEQELPVRRQVALKVIKLGMDTAAVIARFEAERQALALMDHPNIARVLDAGATAAGRPYFVMELVRGVRITDYCDRENLPTADRLALFTHVCHAIQHAHHKGVIHRDIKPSNILVTLQDGAPVPKVIDFGIAKATQGRLADQTLFTAFEQFVGTPAYMSPEQAGGGGTDIDTRSDIYSLGVLLYELLAGRPPFEPATLRAAGLDEIRRIIREVEPPRPSTRLATLADADRSSVARHRDAAPAQLSALLRGDLDWIVMRCLAKDRARRYDTPGALAADIARHLEDEPVLARPPSRVDRARKLLARHRLAFAAAAALAVLLVTGLAVSTRLYLREKRALDRAVAAERTQGLLRLDAEAALTRATAAEKIQATLAAQAQAARNTQAGLRELADAARASEAQLRLQAEAGEARARSESARSAQVARLMGEMLKNVGPHVALGRDTRLLRDILDDTAQRLGRDLAGQPRVELELREIIAAAYADLGDFTAAVAMRRAALALHRELSGEASLPVALAWMELGRALLSLGSAPEAEAALRTAVPLQEKFGVGPPTRALGLLALALERQGRLPEAEALRREILAANRDRGGDRAADVAGSVMNLAGVLARQGRRDEAERLTREAIATLRTQPDPDVPLANLLSHFALLLRDEGKLDEAVAALQESLDLQQKVLGPDHPDRANRLVNLGSILRSRGCFAESEAAYREALALQHKILGADHPALIGTLHDLGYLLQTQRRWDEAQAAFDDALRICRLQPATADTPTALVVLAQLAEARGRPDDAIRRYTATADLLRQSASGSGSRLALPLTALARLLRAQGRTGEADRIDAELAAPPPAPTAVAAAAAPAATAPPPAPRPLSRPSGTDTVRILSVTPAQFTALKPTQFVVRVRYTLVSVPKAQLVLGFNTRAANAYPSFATRPVTGGADEIELTALVTPVRYANQDFIALVSLAPEVRAPGSGSLASDRRALGEK